MTSLGPRGPSDAGLQAERTTLAWTRTSLVALVNGALLLVPRLQLPIGPVRVALAGLALVLAGTTYLIGTRRQRTLARRPLPRRITPRREVYLVGVAVLVLIVAVAVALPI